MSGIEIRVCGRYRLESLIKKADKRAIYSAVNVQTNQQVVVKAEESKGKKDNLQSLLAEGKIMQSLQGGIGIPSMHWCGLEQDYNLIVMESLGKNLDEQLKRCGGKFTLKTTLMIGQQLVNILQYFHFKNFLHRNVSPSNFIIGRGKKNSKIYLIDYSDCKRYRDQKSLEHYPLRQSEKSQVNTVFSSLNFHKGLEASRRDDIQSMVLMLIYFLKGLPWDNVQGVTAQSRSNAILEMKTQVTLEQLCQGLPKQFGKMMEHVRSLGFEDNPDYTYFKNVFKQRMSKEGILNDSIFDWVLLPTDRVHLPVDYYPLKLQVIPNEQEFVKNHMQQFRKEEESGIVQQCQPVPAISGTAQQTKINPVKGLKEGTKEKQCLLF